MENESKVELPNCVFFFILFFFLISPRQEVGGIRQSYDGKKRQEKGASLLAVFQRSGHWVLFGEKSPSAEPHTQPVEIGTEVQSKEPGLQLREPHRTCLLEVCRPVGHTLKTQETPLRAVKVFCFILISPACR